AWFLTKRSGKFTEPEARPSTIHGHNNTKQPLASVGGGGGDDALPVDHDVDTACPGGHLPARRHLRLHGDLASLPFDLPHDDLHLLADRSGSDVADRQLPLYDRVVVHRGQEAHAVVERGGDEP